MDFEDYGLAGLGTAGGLALGGKVVGQSLGNKWGEDAYYRSKARSLANQTDAENQYQKSLQQIENSDLHPKLKQRQLQKLQAQRQSIIGKSLQNTERDAEKSRTWDKGKGMAAGALGTGLLGGAVGLGYGISNDFKRNNKQMAKFSRKRNSIYVEFKRAYNQAVANFASPPSLLSAMPNAVKIGAGIGGGIGLLQGSGVLESDAEKKATNVGNRLGKVLTSTTVGAGLGAGAGYAANRYNNAIIAPQREMQRREAVVAAHEAANPRGVRKAVKVVKDAGRTVGEEFQNVKQEVQKIVNPNLEQREARMAEDLQRQSVMGQPSLLDRAAGKAQQDIETTKQFFGNVFRRKPTGTNNQGFNGQTINMEKSIRKSANFQDPATIQRLIQYGSTYIPQDNTGVVSLETTLRGKMQKKKLREPRVPASMGVKEINSMIESGKPTGKYFNKEIRKSANFLKRQQEAEFGIGDQINNALTSAGKYLTQPAARAVRKAATQVGGGDRLSILGNRIAAKIPFVNQMNHGAAKVAAGGHKALTGVADALETDKAARLAAIGVGGTALAGGGLLAAKLAQKKQEDESRYNKKIRKSASFGVIPTGLVSGAQKAVAGTAKRFSSTSPLINAANVGTAVGAGLGALEGSGINETEEQRRSTGLVGRAGKVLGMTGLGAGVGRGVGSAAGYGIDKYQTSQRWNARNKARAAKGMPSPTDTPTKINIQDQDE